MKTKHHKFVGSKFFITGLAVLAAAILSMGAAKADQASDQVAVQLGAIQLNILLGPATTPEDLSKALVQGRNVLASLNRGTTSKPNNGLKPYVIGATFPTNAADIQSPTLQGQILHATQNAIENPITLPFPTPVKSQVSTLDPVTGKTKVVSVTLNSNSFNAKKTKASTIFSYASKKIPNFGPGLVQDAVAGAFAGQGTPVFGYTGNTPAKVLSAQLADAGKIAGLAMSTALKGYKTGTANWAGVPRTGIVTGVPYLPNFSSKPLPSSSVDVTLQQPANLGGISEAASAVAANAINGLGNTVAGSYGKTGDNVQSLTRAIIKGAVRFQKTSLGAGSNTTIGAIGGASLGLTAQVAGDQNFDWGSTVGGADATTAILNGVVAGALKASKSNAYYIAYGIVQGFAGTYIKTMENASLSIGTLAAFITENSGDIDAAFTLANNNRAVLFKNQSQSTVPDVVSAAVTDVWNAFGYNNLGVLDPSARNIGSLTGADGINLFGVVNGVGLPVTDTVGL